MQRHFVRGSKSNPDCKLFYNLLRETKKLGENRETISGAVENVLYIRDKRLLGHADLQIATRYVHDASHRQID